jgi:hypothetical protein
MTTAERYAVKANEALEQANLMTTAVLKAEYRLLACEWLAIARVAGDQAALRSALFID